MTSIHYKWSKIIASKLHGKTDATFDAAELQELLDDIRAIEERNSKKAIELLRDLADLQNGAPLETYRKDWEETMQEVYDFLSVWEGNAPLTD